MSNVGRATGCSLVSSRQESLVGNSMSVESLLKKLADGRFHSGAELGKALGVSRTAIWKQVKKVEELGLPLESVKGKGYRLVGGLELLSEEKIGQSISKRTQLLISKLDLVGVTESTNTIAMAKALEGVSGYVCAAEQQTAGRGRRGRQWSSPYGSSLALSVTWEFAAGVAAIEGLSLAVGVAVVNALAVAGVESLQLKWPNDVLHNGKKLSGVLLEIAGDAEGPCRVVVGVGVNVSPPPSAMKGVDQPWTDISTIVGSSISRNHLLALLLDQLLEVLSEFEGSGFKAYFKRWSHLDAYLNKDVAVRLAGKVIFGRNCGVNESGAIVIENESGRLVFNGGEVSLRSVSDRGNGKAAD